MKKPLFLLPVALAFAACSSNGPAGPAPAPPPDQQSSDRAFRASIARLAVAWDAGDGNGWAGEYWPDGSLINILGAVFPNAQSVGAVTNQILAGSFKGSTLAPVVRRVRFVGSDVAIVETDVSVTNFRALPGGAVATRPGLLLTRLTHVFESRNGMWKIEASQNTSVLPSADRMSPS